MELAKGYLKPIEGYGEKGIIFQFLTEDTSFFSKALSGLTNITFQIPQDSLSERILEGNAVTLSDELTEHRAVSQKASFQF